MFDSLFPLGAAHYLAGGLLIGAGVALIFLFTGLVSGMSTVFSSTCSFFSRSAFFQQPRFTGTRTWRLVLAAGLVLGALLWWALLGPEGGADTGGAVAITARRVLRRTRQPHEQRLHVGSWHLRSGVAASAFAARGRDVSRNRDRGRQPRCLVRRGAMKTSALFAVLAGGILFGFGLALSSMISPEVVLGFLRLHDFGLLLVLGAAVVVALIAYQLAPRLMRRPLLAPQFGEHPSVLNRDTIVGAALFGVGWGLCGVCPGPAIAGVGAGNWPLLLALVGIGAGAYVHGRFLGRAA
jgi:hypothetical protein